MALGKTWCPDHFNCANSQCRRSLQEIGFVEEQGQLYCENCFEQYLAPICAKCSNRIKGVICVTTSSFATTSFSFADRIVYWLWTGSGIHSALLAATVKTHLEITASIWKTASHTAKKTGTSFSLPNVFLVDSRLKVSAL